MKRKITLSIALVVSLIVLLLTSFDSRVEAENQMRYVADTGFIKPGPNQELRVSVAVGDVNGDQIHVRFRRLKYIEQGNIYKVASQTTSPPITLSADEAASVDAADLAVWRLMVLSDSKNMRVTVQLIDKTTGQVDSVLIALINGLPGVN